MLDQQSFDASIVSASTEILRGGTQSSITSALAHSNPQTLMKVTSGDTQITFCTCLKCGSTSFFLALYNALHEDDFLVTNHPPYVQDWGRWSSPLVSRSPYPGDLNVVIYRDPIERYVSSFRHRAACCTEYVKECTDQEEKAFFVNILLELNNEGEKSCLAFDEFVQQLETAAARGVESILNLHWIPQDITCPHTPDTIFVTIDELAPELTRLSSKGYIHGNFLANLDIGHLKKHAVAQKHMTVDYLAQKYPEAMSKLCALASREYARFGKKSNEVCSI